MRVVERRKRHCLQLGLALEVLVFFLRAEAVLRASLLRRYVPHCALHHRGLRVRGALEALLQLIRVSSDGRDVASRIVLGRTHARVFRFRGG